MSINVSKAPECVYCGAALVIDQRGTFVRCKACGQSLEIARFTEEEIELSQNLREAAQAAEKAERAVRENAARWNQRLSQAAKKAEEQRKHLLEEVNRLKDQITGSAAVRLQKTFAMGEAAQRKGNYHKAVEYYERVACDSLEQEAEVHWRIALCTFGVEYVYSQKENRWLPTILHMIPEKFSEDENYRTAIRIARTQEIREFYSREAERIDAVMNSYRELDSAGSCPCDVFVSGRLYDDDGNPTQDSVTVMQLYNAAKEKGLRVFHSGIDPENYAGKVREAVVMAALASARVMVVVGHNAENMNSGWVRNEWRRFRWLKEQSNDNRCLVVYMAGMKGEDLPWGMGQFRIINADQETDAPDHFCRILEERFPKQHAHVPDPQENLLDRARISLAQSDFDKAREQCEQVLNINVHNVFAYVLKLCADLELRNEAELEECEVDFLENPNYLHLLVIADKAYKDKLTQFAEAAALRAEVNRKNEEMKRLLMCNKCGSLSISSKNKGYRVGKAALGYLLLGPLGSLAGFAGSQDLLCTCQKCGYEFTVKRSLISALLE